MLLYARHLPHGHTTAAPIETHHLPSYRHPCETSFTLLELGGLLEGAGLVLLGVWFASLEAGRHARQAYDRAAAAEGGYGPGDGPDRQVRFPRPANRRPTTSSYILMAP